MKNRPAEIKPSKEFERALAQCTPEDFDGHTEFHRLTPEQRLDWFVLRGSEYDRLAVSPAGFLQSEVFPGLWLDAAAVYTGS